MWFVATSDSSEVFLLNLKSWPTHSLLFPIDSLREYKGIQNPWFWALFDDDAFLLTEGDELAPPAFWGDFGGLRLFNGDRGGLRFGLAGDDFAEDELDRVVGGVGVGGGMARSGGQFRDLEQ